MAQHPSDDDIEARLRRALAEHAEQAPPPGLVEQRILAAARRGDARSRRPRWLSVRSLRPVAVAASVLVVIGATAGGVALVQSLDSGSHPAATRSTASTATATATRTGSSSVPTPTPSQPPAVSGTPDSTTAIPTVNTPVEPRIGKVPKGFAVADLTFVGTQNGWALGTTSKCSNRPCTSLVRTTNGGRTWVGLSPPIVSLVAADDCTVKVCLTNVRFASTKVGYLFGPKVMFLTTDGGASWESQSGGAVALEIAAGNVLRVTTAKPGCTASCSYVVEQSPIGGATWTTVYATHPFAQSDGAYLARVGSKAFLQINGGVKAPAGSGPGALFATTDAGATWTQRPGACLSASGKLAGTSFIPAVTTAPDGSFTVLCSTRVNNGGNHVETSTDDGATFQAGTATSGISGPVGASSHSVLFAQSIAADARQATLLRSSDGGLTWGAVAHTGMSGYGGAFGGFIGFENASTGRWVSPADPRTVWTTTDAGAHWTAHTFD